MSYNLARRFRRNGSADLATQMRRMPAQMRKQMSFVPPTPADDGAFEGRLKKRRTKNRTAKASRRVNR